VRPEDSIETHTCGDVSYHHQGHDQKADPECAEVTCHQSRVIIPSAGGQTIQVPEKMMADAYGLWLPLTESEQKALNSVPAFPLENVDAGLTAWLPPTEQETMRRYMSWLTHQRRDLARKVLQRADVYLPAILAALGERGLPLELACLPMVESAFEPRAVSHAGAAGLWQLMPETARRFGLTVTGTVDERFDVQKSTVAAIAYLETLYAKFRDWPLALAAYNCGEGAMQRALANTDTGSLAEVTLACRTMGVSSSPLAEETLQFVPKFAAAVHIMTNRDTFGLTTQALFRREPSSHTVQEQESSLTLSGRYQPGQEQPPLPARSKRIE
jgi:membrane-bound lytic murein transglycosylase D